MRGLELRKRFPRAEFHKDDGLRSRAEMLTGDAGVSIAGVRRIDAFFKASAADYRPSFREPDGGPDHGTISYMCWGGPAAADWAAQVLGDMQKAGVEHSDQLGKSLDVTIAKVDDELGIVFGYAIICTEGGEEYFDTQGDHIPEAAMLEATAEYMAGDRIAKNMHRGGPVGQVVFGFPMTGDIAKALGIDAPRTGFIVGMRPDDEALLTKYRTGEYTGFSIGGRRMQETVVDA